MLNIVDNAKMDIINSINACLSAKNLQPIRLAARWQKELIAVLAQERSDILWAEWLDEDDVDLSGLSDGNDESDAMPIVAIEEHLAFPWEDDRS